MLTPFHSHRTRRPTRSGLLLAVFAALALVAAACGDDDDEVGTGDEPTTTIAAPGGLMAVPADLTITAGTTDEPESAGTATLTCGEESDAAEGTEWLDGDAAGRACLALTDAEILAALDPPPDDQVCTEQFGGPSVATISGTVDGEPVEADLDRRDGCAISRWDILQPLLPEPVDPS